jgi:hypothetical protein
MIGPYFGRLIRCHKASNDEGVNSELANKAYVGMVAEGLASPGYCPSSGKHNGELSSDGTTEGFMDFGGLRQQRRNDVTVPWLGTLEVANYSPISKAN